MSALSSTFQAASAKPPYSNMLTMKQWLNQSVLPRLESRLLLQHITQLTHAQLITHDQQILTTPQLAQLHQLHQRRINGEPIAYLIGYKEFFGRTFHVTPDVLIPRPETEQLVEIALSKTPKNGHILDLGTGSGIIAITLKLERPDLHIYATDISPKALNIAQHNAQQLHAPIQLMQGSWFQALQTHALAKHHFHTIVANPPYIEANDPHLTQGDLRFEPQHALTDFADGYQAIHTLAKEAPTWLHKQGWLIIEHGYQQGYQSRQIFQTAGLTQVQTLTDLAQLDRITLGQYL